MKSNWGWRWIRWEKCLTKITARQSLINHPNTIFLVCLNDHWFDADELVRPSEGKTEIPSERGGGWATYSGSSSHYSYKAFVVIFILWRWCLHALVIMFQPQEVIKEEATVSIEVVEETDDTLQVKNKTLTKDRGREKPRCWHNSSQARGSVRRHSFVGHVNRCFVFLC